MAFDPSNDEDETEKDTSGGQQDDMPVLEPEPGEDRD